MKIRNYKGIYVNSFGIPVKNPNFNNKKDKINITKRSYGLSFNSDFSDNSPKDLVVIYDVPEEQKKERDWFRRHLKKFNYIMIQRSVWVGPSPLPKDFIAYVKSIGLKDKLKTFKLAKAYSKNDNLFK